MSINVLLIEIKNDFEIKESMKTYSALRFVCLLDLGEITACES